MQKEFKRYLQIAACTVAIIAVNAFLLAYEPEPSNIHWVFIALACAIFGIVSWIRFMVKPGRIIMTDTRLQFATEYGEDTEYDSEDGTNYNIPAYYANGVFAGTLFICCHEMAYDMSPEWGFGQQHPDNSGRWRNLPWCDMAANNHDHDKLIAAAQKACRKAVAANPAIEWEQPHE